MQGNFTVELTEPIPVAPGMQIGFQFKERNVIPWSDIECYKKEDQMQFHIRQDGVSQETELEFSQAPLSENPCRLYSFSATIG